MYVAATRAEANPERTTILRLGFKRKDDRKSLDDLERREAGERGRILRPRARLIYPSHGRVAHLTAVQIAGHSISRSRL